MKSFRKLSKTAICNVPPVFKKRCVFCPGDIYLKLRENLARLAFRLSNGVLLWRKFQGAFGCRSMSLEEKRRLKPIRLGEIVR